MGGVVYSVVAGPVHFRRCDSRARTREMREGTCGMYVTRNKGFPGYGRTGTESTAPRLVVPWFGLRSARGGGGGEGGGGGFAPVRREM
jgi:hypothetical protein